MCPQSWKPDWVKQIYLSNGWIFFFFKFSVPCCQLCVLCCQFSISCSAITPCSVCYFYHVVFEHRCSPKWRLEESVNWEPIDAISKRKTPKEDEPALKWLTEGKTSQSRKSGIILRFILVASTSWSLHPGRDWPRVTPRDRQANRLLVLQWGWRSCPCVHCTPVVRAALSPPVSQPCEWRWRACNLAASHPGRIPINLLKGANLPPCLFHDYTMFS